MAAVAQHKEMDYGTYMGIKIIKHLNISSSGVIDRKFFVASDEKTDWFSASETFKGIKEKIDEHLRECEQIKKQGSVTKFMLYKAVAEIQNKSEIIEGCGLKWNTELHLIEVFDNQEEALKSLKKFKTEVIKAKSTNYTYYKVAEYTVIEELHSKWSERKEEIAVLGYSKNNFKN